MFILFFFSVTASSLLAPPYFSFALFLVNMLIGCSLCCSDSSDNEKLPPRYFNEWQDQSRFCGHPMSKGDGHDYCLKCRFTKALGSEPCLHGRQCERCNDFFDHLDKLKEQRTKKKGRTKRKSLNNQGGKAQKTQKVMTQPTVDKLATLPILQQVSLDNLRELSASVASLNETPPRPSQSSPEDTAAMVVPPRRSRSASIKRSREKLSVEKDLPIEIEASDSEFVSSVRRCAELQPVVKLRDVSPQKRKKMLPSATITREQADRMEQAKQSSKLPADTEDRAPLQQVGSDADTPLGPLTDSVPSHSEETQAPTHSLQLQEEEADSGVVATDQETVGDTDPISLNPESTSTQPSDMTQLDKEQFRAELLKQLKRLDEFMEKGAHKVEVAQPAPKTEERGFQTPLAWAPPTPPVPPESQPRLTLVQTCALPRRLLGFDHVIQNPPDDRPPGIPSSNTSFSYFQELQTSIAADPSAYKVPPVP